MLDCEVSLDSELFDPAVRAGLSEFFEQALARDYRARYDNAEEMRRAWFRVFEAIDRPASATDPGEAVDIDAMLEDATEATPLVALGLSARILNAVDRMGAHTLGELVRLPRIRLYRNKGIGQKTVREIRELAERVADHFARSEWGGTEHGERPVAAVTVPPEDELPVDPKLWSVDLMAGKVAGARVAEGEAQLLKCLLGLDTEVAVSSYAPQQEVADTLGLDRSAIQKALETARQRWSRQPWMTALREDIARLVDKHAGVMTGGELGEAVLAARGSVADGAERYRLATAVAYAALETEVARENARFLLYREGRRVLVIATESLGSPYRASVAARAQYAKRLGERADELAVAEPLLAPVRAAEALSSLPAPEGDRPIPPDRLVRLAVRASEQAALSSRMEIYPKSMPAPRALKLGMGSLLGPKALTVQQIQQRIGSRYPEAAPIPGPPRLTRLLAEAGIELVWDGQSQRYSPKLRIPGDPSTTSTLQRLSTASVPGATPTPEVEDARALEDRIRQAVEHRRFLVLSVAPKHLLRAERELLGRFPLRRVSIEGLLIDRMKSLAGQAGASWEVVLRADGTEREGNDWRNLMTLVRRAVGPLEQALLRLEGPALLVYPGLLARYGQMDVLERLRDAGDREAGSPGFIVLVPADRQTDMPVIDGREFPVVLASQWAHLTEAWISNAHRSQTSSRRDPALWDGE